MVSKVDARDEKTTKKPRKNEYKSPIQLNIP